ncbi:MAG: T9SS type A sorting domain-containing protein [Saprospiraceae bacterium]
MKYINLIFVLLIYSFGYSQTTVTNSFFPSVGDVLVYNDYGDQFPETLLDVQGGPYSWDFNSIDSFSFSSITEYKDPSTNSFHTSFPNANLLMEGDDQGIIFMNKSTQNILVEGRVSENPIDDSSLLPIKDSKRHEYAIAPMTLGTDLNSSSLFLIGFGSEIIPDTILESLPIKVDSLRVNANFENKGKIEAWGNLLVNNDSHDVLLEKSQNIASIQFEVKVPFIGWLNPAALGFELPEPFSNFIGADTSTVYRFYKDGHIDKMAEISYFDFGGGNVLSRLQIEASLVTVFTFDFESDPEWQVFPNPSFSHTPITLSSLPKGHNLQIQVVDLSGKEVSVQNVSQSTSEEVIELPKFNGIFTVRLIDHTSQKISSRRIIKF